MTRTSPPLVLSFRAAGVLLGTDRATVANLVRTGILRAVPWGDTRIRIPLAEIQRIAAEGWTQTPTGRPRPSRPTRSRSRVDPEALRKLDVNTL